MAELSLDQAIPRFKANENRMDIFTNGSDTTVMTTSAGELVPSLRKFIKDKDTQINNSANSILSQSQAARDAAAGSANAASTSASNAGAQSNAAYAWAQGDPVAAGAPAGSKSAKSWAADAANSAASITGLPATNVGSIAQIKAIDTSKSKAVFLTQAGREGAFVFLSGDYSAPAASDASTNGIYIPANGIATSSGCWVRVVVDEVNVKWFGATGNGSTDDYSTIQAAINILPARGGTVYFPGGTYKVNTPLVCGSGNSGNTPSPKNGIKLRGEGAGFAVSGALVPTIISYGGALTGQPLISFQGQISDCAIEGIFLACNKLCAGLALYSVSGALVRAIKIVSPAPSRAAIAIIGGHAPVGNYNTFNSFSQIQVALTEANSVGLSIDGDYSVQNDTWISKFELLRIETVPGATNATCAWFKFVDSCTFLRCHFDSSPEPTAYGAIIDAMANDGFPCGMHFIDCSIKNVIVYEDSTHKIRKNYFSNHGTYDNEVVPNHPMLVGFTDTGLSFGPIGYAVGAGGVTTQQTSKATPVGLDRLSGQITMNAGSLAANTSVSFTFTNAFLASADLVVLNITGGGTYGAYYASVSDVQNGLAVITLRNVSGAALAESVVLAFAVIKVAVN